MLPFFSSTQLFGPTAVVKDTLALPRVASSTFFAPSLAYAVTLPTLSSSQVFAGEIVTQGTTQGLALPLISASQLFAPDVRWVLALPLLSTGSRFAPSLSAGVGLPTLASTQLFPPTVITQFALTLPALASTVLYAPLVTQGTVQGLLLPLVTSTRFYPPSVANFPPAPGAVEYGPPLVTVADYHDPDCGCCMATKLKVANQALLKIGVSQTIVSFTEQTRETYTIAELFDESLREAQRSYPWAFATKYAALVLFTGTSSAPANNDWVYAWRYPTDALFVRRLVRPGTGRAFDAQPPEFRIGRDEGSDGTNPDDDTLLIFSNETDLDVEYTRETKCSVNYADAVFEDALSWLVGSKIAPSLSRDSKMAEKCYAMFERTFSFAATLSAREQQQPIQNEGPDWIRDR